MEVPQHCRGRSTHTHTHTYTHTCIQVLDFGENMIEDAGAEALPKAVVVNVSLTEIGLAENPIEEHGNGARHLSNASWRSAKEYTKSTATVLGI